MPDDGHAIKLARAAGICQEVTRKYQDRDWVLIKGDDMWSKINHLILDSLQSPGEYWVRSAGLDEAWTVSLSRSFVVLDSSVLLGTSADTQQKGCPECSQAVTLWSEIRRRPCPLRLPAHGTHVEVLETGEKVCARGSFQLSLLWDLFPWMRNWSLAHVCIL